MMLPSARSTSANSFPRWKVRMPEIARAGGVVAFVVPVALRLGVAVGSDVFAMMVARAVVSNGVGVAFAPPEASDLGETAGAHAIMAAALRPAATRQVELARFECQRRSPEVIV